MNNTRHGFLQQHPDHSFAALLVVDDNSHPIHIAVSSPQGLIRWALNFRLTHLWVMPGYGRELTEEQALQPSASPEAQNYDFKVFTNKYTGLVSSIVGRGLNPRTENVNIIYVSQSSWGIREVGRLQRLICAVEQQLGVPMKGSPTSVGLRYLEKIDARYYRRYFADPDIDKAALKPIFSEAAKPLIWCRLPTEDELTPRPELYLVAMDKRAAYPRAASEERMGIGSPRHQIGGEFNPKLPGCWDVTVSGLDKVDSCLPAPLWNGWNGSLVTPLVKMVKALGCEVLVNEAMVWDTSAPVFDRWAKELWKFRQNVPMAKPIMNNTLGFTVNGNDMSDEKYRPDWHATIVGGLRALMMYNAMKIACESGFYPIGCYIDALYYLTPYRNSVPGLVLMPESMGGYAMKWCIPVTDEVRGIITSPDELQHFNMMLNKLNTIAGVQE